jgi:hypothetical protein
MVRIDHLNFENKQLIHDMKTIRAMYSIIAQLYIYIYILATRDCFTSASCLINKSADN